MASFEVNDMSMYIGNSSMNNNHIRNNRMNLKERFFFIIFAGNLMFINNYCSVKTSL